MTPSTCNGVCLKYKVKNKIFTNLRYSLGQKRCQMCAIYMQYDGRFCPCCGIRLRTRSRIKKHSISTPITSNIEMHENG